MELTIGKLKFLPAKEHPELTTVSVTEVIKNMVDGDKIGIVEIDPSFSDTTAFCRQYGVELNQVANCVILEAKRADRNWFAACVILANTRADVNGLARRTLDARKVSFAPMEKAVAESLMEYGAITPVGLPATWSILVDKAVTELPHVIIGSGIRNSKLVVSGNLFASLPNVKILEGLGRVVEDQS